MLRKSGAAACALPLTPRTSTHPPGNINQLVLKLDTYCDELKDKSGVIAEFVNPKYADASRTTFKSSTRLECMMQARREGHACSGGLKAAWHEKGLCVAAVQLLRPACEISDNPLLSNIALPFSPPPPTPTQDFPKGLPASAKVGYTSVNQVWAAYSPVKNSPADAADKAKGGNPSHSATSGELDFYEANCKVQEQA